MENFIKLFCIFHFKKEIVKLWNFPKYIKFDELFKILFIVLVNEVENFLNFLNIKKLNENCEKIIN
jgi:hypothetical protein